MSGGVDVLPPVRCALCPRRCGADRTRSVGLCGAGGQVRVARAAPHFWEEPCISGARTAGGPASGGSGCVFFSGCPLGCVYCQNAQISAEHYGAEVSVERLAAVFLELQAAGVHNLNLVSPTQYRPWIKAALDLARPALRLPVVYNTGGYETVASVRALRDNVDVWLPDCKYLDPARSQRYSGAADYFERCAEALRAMYEQTGPVRFDENGLMTRGLLIRHMVLPKGWRDSMALLERLAALLPVSQVRLSLLRQYVPCHRAAEYPEINRRVSTYEYDRVVERAAALGFTGYTQQRDSADSAYTPPFDLEGVLGQA